MKRGFILLAGFALAAAASIPMIAQSQTPAPTSTPAPTATLPRYVLPTNTPEPTATLPRYVLPTNTPEPTATLPRIVLPTNTGTHRDPRPATGCACGGCPTHPAAHANTYPADRDIHQHPCPAPDAATTHANATPARGTHRPRTARHQPA
jgi:hypothetical protein